LVSIKPPTLSKDLIFIHRHAEGGIKGEDTNAARVRITRWVLILVLVGDLNECVPGYAALLVDLPEQCVPALRLVLSPNGL
jgi:hypothetical protein